MSPADAIRWIHYEAGRCRDRDQAEALCLLLPPILRQCALEPMTEAEAAAFRQRLKMALQGDLRRAA